MLYQLSYTPMRPRPTNGELRALPQRRNTSERPICHFNSKFNQSPKIPLVVALLIVAQLWQGNRGQIQ